MIHYHRIVTALLIALALVGYGQYRRLSRSERSNNVNIPKPYLFKTLKYPYALPALPYGYDALEPHLDEATMKVHHQKHHQAYVDNLNKALEQYPAYQSLSLEELLVGLSSLPQDIKKAIQDHGGGHYNHSLFWQILAPASGQKPSDFFAGKINEAFSSFEQFKELFNKTARTCFGSGWVWLCLDHKDKLVVLSTQNQDCPLETGLRPVLGLDVWEHAYYLKFQNRRMDYVDAWWHVLNWQQIEENYKKALEE